MIAHGVQASSWLNALYQGLAHPVLGWDHLLAMIAVGMVAGGGSKRLMWSAPATFVVLLLLGGAAGAAGFVFAYTEVIVAVSIAAFGSMILAKPSSVRSDLILISIGAFAYVHGLAHGGELPHEARFLPFALGFGVTSAALHIAGVPIGMAAGSHNRVRRIVGVGLLCGACLVITMSGLT